MSRYATLADFDDCGLPLAAFADFDKAMIQRQLDRASGYADGFLRDSYTLPMVGVPDPGLVMAVCQIAAWWLMVRRGFDPENPGDKVVYSAYRQAEDWLKMVANKKIAIAITQGAPASLQPNVGSNQARGYGDLTGCDPAANDPRVGGNDWGI